MKVLLIGLGNSGRAHLRAYRNLGIQPYISDLDVEKELFWQRKGFPVGSLNEHYEYVDICVPTHLHYQLCKKWLEKTNVLIEKPFCLESAHAEELIQLAEKNGKKLAVCHNQLYYPLLEDLPWITVEKMVINRSYNEFYSGWVFAYGGGPLYETGYHALYIMLHWLRKKPKLEAYTTKDHGRQEIIFDNGFISIFPGKKSLDYILLPDENQILFPWYNSKHINLRLRQIDIYTYMALHREFPHTCTYRKMLQDWIMNIQNQPVFAVPRRLSPYLSLDCVKILEECEKWSDET